MVTTTSRFLPLAFSCLTRENQFSTHVVVIRSPKRKRERRGPPWEFIVFSFVGQLIIRNNMVSQFHPNFDFIRLYLLLFSSLIHFYPSLFSILRNLCVNVGSDISVIVHILADFDVNRTDCDKKLPADLRFVAE